MTGLALLAAVVPVALVLATYRNERIVALVAATSLVAVAVFPMHLVPSAIRFAEIGWLLLTVAVVRLRRPARTDAVAMILLLAYLAGTWYATSGSMIEGAGFQLLMHAVTLLAFVVFGSDANPDERRVIYRTLVVVAVLESLYALYEFATQPDVLWASPVPEAMASGGPRLPHEVLDGAVRSQGTFGHPLLLAFFLLAALAVALRADYKRSINRTVVILILLAGLGASGSRSALVVAIALLAFTVGVKRFSFWRGVIVSGIILAIAAASSFFTSDTYRRFTEGGSLSHRLETIDVADRLMNLRESTQVWFGDGWYSIESLAARGLLQSDGFVAIDNQWVALLAVSGVVGLAVWIILLLRAMRLADGPSRLALAAVVAMFFAFDALQFPATCAVAALLLGVAVRTPERASARPEVTTARPSSIRR